MQLLMERQLGRTLSTNFRTISVLDMCTNEVAQRGVLIFLSWVLI